MKVTALLFLTIISVFQLGCRSAKKTADMPSTDEFEGVITYHEIYKTDDGAINMDDTVQFFYAHGNYVNLHSVNSPGTHIVKDYYFEKKALRLLLFNNSDTLHQLSLNFPIEKLDSFKVKKVTGKILSRNCENIETDISYKEKDSTTYTKVSFTFSRGYLKIDKQHFKNWNLGFFNRMIDESGAFYLNLKTVHFGSSHKNILSSKTFNVISVKEEPVDPKVFVIDTTKIK